MSSISTDLSTSTSLATALAAATPVTTATVPANQTSNATAATDTVTISDAAQQAADAAEQRRNAAVLKGILDRVNSFEHQVTWQIDHHTDVTAPTGANASASTGQIISTATNVAGGKGYTDGFGITLQVSSPTGTQALSFAGSATLSSVATSVNAVKDVTGVSATVSGTALKFSNANSSASHFISVKAISGNLPLTASADSGVNESLSDKIAEGFTDLYSGTLNGADQQKLDVELQRFQTFANKRAGGVAALTPTPAEQKNFDGLVHLLGGDVNSFEHQVTWQIDHQTDITTPNTIKPTSSTTAADSPAKTQTSVTDAIKAISDGFDALKADLNKKLGSSAIKFATQIASLNERLGTEQTRVQGFAARRLQGLLATKSALTDIIA